MYHKRNHDNKCSECHLTFSTLFKPAVEVSLISFFVVEGEVKT